MTNDTMTPEPLTAELQEDPRSAMADALATCGDLLHSLRPADLDLPSTCPGMDVRQLTGHLVMAAKRIACAARFVPPHEWPTDVTGLADDEWAPAWHDAAAEALGAWSDAALLDQHMVLPWAEMSGREVVGIYTNEIFVHGWEVAQAVGQNPTWSRSALQIAEVAIHSQLPLADRSPIWDAAKATLPEGVPWADPFANAVPVAADAPLLDRVLAWNGRQP